MAQDTLLGFPAHTLPFRRGEFTTLLTDCEKAPEGCLFFFGKRTFHAFFVCFAHSQRRSRGAQPFRDTITMFSITEK